MKKQFLLLSFLLAGILARADYSIDWMRTTDIFSNMGTAIAHDTSDNIYTTTSTGSIYLEKRDKFGNLKWQVSSSTTIPFNYEYPAQVYVDPQGNPVVVGYRYTISSEGHFANSLIVLKYDASGNLIYKKNFDGTYSYFNNSQYWTKVTSQMDGAGNVYIGTAGNVSGYPIFGFNAIKVSPTGNIVRVSAKSLNPGFHFVNQIRLKGKMLGLAGTTLYSTANATLWVLDTSGADLWNSVSVGIQGKDVSFDNAGNTFLLTSAVVTSYADVRLYKFNGTGIQLFSKSYDFGGSELTSRMEMMPDGNIAILAYGNTAPSGSWYTDWITMKVALNGNLLWADRYAETKNNDEIPYWMTVDPENNIYVTGIGGPFPGGTNLGARQMVTVKYSPTGTREWASAIDTMTEYLTGVAITVASDGSIFVVGDSKTLIVHYLDFTGSDPCLVPTNVTANAITDDAATIKWTAVPNAYLYHVQYKTSTSSTWLKVSTDVTSFTLSSLFPGTKYNYQVEAICNSGPTGYSTIKQFTTLGSSYCPSMGLDATKEWIDLVFLGTILNSSVSNGGYADFTNLSTDLHQGGTYTIDLSAEMNPGPYNESWRVWIDYNQDGDFLDKGEKEVGYKSSQIGWESHTFVVPANAKLGLTRMRVSMKHGGPGQTPCETFAKGEVEDYSVNIVLSKMTTYSVQQNSNSINVYPNPATNALYVDLTGWTSEVTINIFDLTGKMVYGKQTVPAGPTRLNISDLNNGLYILRVVDSAGNMTSIKWIKE